MSQNHSNSCEEITCENVTDEIVASYAQRGYTLIFAEEVMSYEPFPASGLCRRRTARKIWEAIGVGV